MNGSAIAVHGALLLLVPVMGLLTARRDAARLAWPAVGLLALACASAAPVGSSARAILGIAIAVAGVSVAGGASTVTSAAAAGAFASLAAATALGVERYAGYTLYAVASGLLVLGTAALDKAPRRPGRGWVLATAAVAVAAPLLDFAGRGGFVAPWATLPHALALAAVVSLRREPPRADPVLSVRLDRLERELGLARRAGAVAIVAAAAVHELKGLLSDLGLASEFAAASADPSARERACALVIQTADEARKRALSLLEDMQRAEREAPTACDLSEALADVVAAVAPSPSSSRVSAGAPPGLSCLMRRREIHLALTSLTRNAVAAAGRRGGTAVAMRAAAAGPGVEIELSDEAGGLPLDLRLDGFDAPPHPGEGLGLVLAARLIEQNGGRLDYLSAEGRSCFRVSLPGRVDSGGDRLL